ncbi:MAG TPA: hypothetical protein VGI45_33375 [Terracidiphilus sp.]|jgi:hypothetical protein
MELGPITGIRETAKLDSTRNDLEVKPAFGLERCSRMGDDAYGGSEEQGERGLEDEDEPPADETAETSETGSNPTEPVSAMNLVA